MPRRSQLFAITIAAVLTTTTLPSTTRAIGYFNLPGTCCQWNGYGCGAGYHAPLVLGPRSWHGPPHHGVVRLPYPPCSAGCYGDVSGYGSCGCNPAEPTMLEPSMLPTPANGPVLDEPMPAPAAFRMPFRY